MTYYSPFHFKVDIKIIKNISIIHMNYESKEN